VIHDENFWGSVENRDCFTLFLSLQAKRRSLTRLLRKRKNELAMTAQRAKGGTASPSEQTRLAVTPERRDCFGNETTTSQWLFWPVIARGEAPKQSGGWDCFASETTSSQWHSLVGAKSKTASETKRRPHSDPPPCHREERSDEAVLCISGECENAGALKNRDHFENANTASQRPLPNPVIPNLFRNLGVSIESTEWEGKVGDAGMMETLKRVQHDERKVFVNSGWFLLLANSEYQPESPFLFIYLGWVCLQPLEFCGSILELPPVWWRKIVCIIGWGMSKNGKWKSVS